MIRTLTILALLTTAAQAGDRVYRCDGGGSITFRLNGREAVIKRPGEMTIAMPREGAAGRSAWWSPYEDSFECTRAPCAVYWQPAKGPAEIEYMLDEGKVVKCFTK